MGKLEKISGNKRTAQAVPLPTVTILEDWVETADGVYYKWRLPSEPEWHFKLTALKQKPVLHFKYISTEELKQLEANK